MKSQVFKDQPKNCWVAQMQLASEWIAEFQSWDAAYDYAHTHTPIPAKVKQ